jgi:ADP-ribosylglycohydrolase
MAGAISGAYNGLDAIPARWRQNVENADGLLEIAEDLLTASGRAARC